MTKNKAIIDEQEQASELLSQNPPRTALDQKGLIWGLVGVAIVLIGLMWVFYGLLQQEKVKNQDSSQDELLQIDSASGDEGLQSLPVPADSEEGQGPTDTVN
jgi:hypothetical protein